MRVPIPVLATLSILAATGALLAPAGASVTSSVSISDSVATSIGSLSTSVKKSSDSSSGDDKVAEGDYRVIEMAEQPAQGDQPVLTRLTLRAVQGTGGFVLLLPPTVAAGQALVPGAVVQARHKPYGLAFAKVDARAAPAAEFFLVVDDGWQRELQARPVRL